MLSRLGANSATALIPQHPLYLPLDRSAEPTAAVANTTQMVFHSRTGLVVNLFSGRPPLLLTPNREQAATGRGQAVRRRGVFSIPAESASA
jgi:hypothetical protein